MSPLFSRDGQVEEINAAFALLTEQEKPAAADQRRPGNYEKILAQGSFGLFRSRIDGHFMEVNSALVKMLGFNSAEELLNENHDHKEFFIEPKGRSRIVQAVEQAAVLEFFETSLRRKDGRTIIVSISLTPLELGEPKEAVAEGMIQDITERKVREEKIRKIAYFDGLTGLPDLSLLRRKVRKTIEEAPASSPDMALISIDIDRFKDINHTLSIARGDRFLQVLGQEFSRFFNAKKQIVSKIEGDDFVIFLSRLTDDEEISRILSHLRKILATPFQFDNQEIYVTASIGIALYPRHGRDLETLFRNANLAMHTAKERSRGSALFYSPHLDNEALEQRELEYRLRRALKENEFDLY